MQQPIVTKAPASAMLFGEHAILRGSIGIVAAIDCCLEVRLTPLVDQDIIVVSSLGQVRTTLSDLSFGPSFRFVEASFRLYASLLPSGAHIEIVSAINPTVGLASSASVTVALLAALQRYSGRDFQKEELLQQSCTVIRSVQGFGSGADAASIIYGGIISYNPIDYSVEPLTASLPLVLAYSGGKRPTPEVIRLVNDIEKGQPTLYKAIFSAIKENAILAAQAIKEKDLVAIGKFMNQAQGLMQSLGVSNPKLTTIWLELIEYKAIYGAKISGSGLGDCVVGLGTMDSCVAGSLISSTVAPKGVSIDG